MDAEPCQSGLLLLIGLPGVGKTSFALKFRDFLKTHKVNVIHVCYDELVPLDTQAKFALNSKSADSAETEWKNERKIILKSVEKLLTSSDSLELSKREEEIFQLLKKKSEEFAKTIVIIDDNNYYQSMRYEYYQLARKLEIGFCQLFFSGDLEFALENNANRSEKERVPNEVIEEMNKKLEPPEPLKNTWEQFSFCIPVAKSNSSEPPPFDVCNSVIDLALENPVKPVPDDSEKRERSRTICNANVIHQSDKILRKKLGLKVKDKQESEKDNADIKDFSKELNEKRLEVLEDLKTGFAKIPEDVLKAVQEKDAGALDRLEDVITNLFELKLSTNTVVKNHD